MPSRLTFGVELEFSFATIQPGVPDPEPHLPQPVFVLYGDVDNWFQRKYVVFDAIVAELVAAGLPARSVKFHNDPEAISLVGSPSSSGGSSRYQDDGVGWIPSRKHRWVWEEHPWNTSGELGNADDELERGEKRSNSEGNDDKLEQGEKESDSEGNDQEKKEENLGFQLNNPLSRGSREEFGPEWQVTDDMSIEPTNPRTYDWIPIEVQSPPYIFCDDALEAVKLACHTLTRNFRLEVNASTGLHVHIGHGASGPPSSTLRNLMAFLWTFEPQLDQLNPTRRPGIPGQEAYDGEPYSWYESLRRGSRLARGEHNGSYKRPQTVLAGLNAIYAVEPDAVSLYDLFRAPSWKAAYHIGHLAYPSSNETIKRTVEFRQHAGTLDGERIAQWVRTIAGIVEFVDEVDGLMLLQLLVEAAEVEDGYVDREDGQGWKTLQYDVVQLLRDIGLEDCAAYWDRTIPVAQRIMPTPYHWSPRKLERRPPAQV